MSRQRQYPGFVIGRNRAEEHGFSLSLIGSTPDLQIDLPLLIVCRVLASNLIFVAAIVDHLGFDASQSKSHHNDCHSFFGAMRDKGIRQGDILQHDGLGIAIHLSSSRIIRRYSHGSDTNGTEEDQSRKHDNHPEGVEAMKEAIELVPQHDHSFVADCLWVFFSYFKAFISA